jgi:hypothetical protein
MTKDNRMRTDLDQIDDQLGHRAQSANLRILLHVFFLLFVLLGENALCLRDVVREYRAFRQSPATTYLAVYGIGRQTEQGLTNVRTESMLYQEVPSAIASVRHCLIACP